MSFRAQRGFFRRCLPELQNFETSRNFILPSLFVSRCFHPVKTPWLSQRYRLPDILHQPHSRCACSLNFRWTFSVIALSKMNSNSIAQVYQKVKADYLKNATMKTQVTTAIFVTLILKPLRKLEESRECATSFIDEYHMISWEPNKREQLDRWRVRPKIFLPFLFLLPISTCTL